MRMARRPTGLLATALLATGCVAVTINVTFPQEKIESAASSIEDLVRTPPPASTAPKKESPPAPAPGPRPEEKKSGAPPAPGMLVAAAAWLGPGVAEAQVPELRTRTPEVMAAIESRRARFPQLAAAMSGGCAGENNQGLVEARPGSGCPPDLNALIAAENRDRMLIYRTLVEQNNMPPEDLARVQAAFAKTNRERAAAGTWVQGPDGRWTRR